MADDAEHADVLQQFLSITGSDEGVALNVLENTDWRLEDAVNLFFATGGEGLGGGAGGGGGGGGGGGAGAAGGAGGGQGGGGAVGPGDYEDEVRRAQQAGRLVEGIRAQAEGPSAASCGSAAPRMMHRLDPHATLHQLSAPAV
jgi:hypothetical protein